MTIEASSASSMARPSESKGVKGKQGNDGDSGGGFTAVLASVETPEKVAAPVGDSATAAQSQAKGADAKPQAKAKGTAPNGRDTAKPDATTSKDAAASDDATTITADVTTVAVPSVGDTGAEPMDTAALLAQSAAWVAASTTASGSTTSVKGQGDFQNEQPGVTAAPKLGASTGSSGLRPPVAPVSAAEGAPQPVVLQSESLPDGIQKSLKAAVDAKGMAVAAPETPLPADGKLAALHNQKQTDGSATQLAVAFASATANVVVSPRREEQPRERSVFRANSNDSAVSPQALSTPAPTQTVSGAPEVVPATDAFVAEKVSYWISNNVQNAEMKLDGVGDRPVEVSIRMQGNEAHVAFRTDELQTRAALENASVHLKDLLQREGLVLTGVSVGTAGTGESGPQDRKSHQGERHTTVATLQPLTDDLRSVTHRTSRGGLDLFV